MTGRKGHPYAPASVVEELLMEIQATAMKGIESDNLETEHRALFVRIVKTAFFTQSVSSGLVTKNFEFNEHLLRLLGEENLN